MLKKNSSKTTNFSKSKYLNSKYSKNKPLRNEKICFIGLGSNLNEPQKQIKTAIDEISKIKGVKLLKSSSLYVTKPIDTPSAIKEQPDFINAVIKVSSSQSPFSLFNELMQIEKLHKRIRTAEKNTPRTLDLDILIFGEKNIKSKTLCIPHPRLKERAFALVPLNEISKKTVKKILGNVDFMKKFKLCSEFRENSDLLKKIQLLC